METTLNGVKRNLHTSFCPNKTNITRNGTNWQCDSMNLLSVLPQNGWAETTSNKFKSEHETPAWVNGVVELVAPNWLSRSMWKAQSESRRVRVQQIPGTHWPARLAKMVAPGPAYLKSKVERLDADVPLWPALRRQRQADLWKLKTSLVYTSRSRPVRITKWNSVSKTKQNLKKKIKAR